MDGFFSIPACGQLLSLGPAGIAGAGVPVVSRETLENRNTAIAHHAEGVYIPR
jgi:hypothetical protein